MSGRKTAIGFRSNDPLARHGFRVKLPVKDEKEEVYTGPYEVRPTPAGQTLPTQGKTMTGDVTVAPIPFYVVSNEAGGKTVYIGDENHG